MSIFDRVSKAVGDVVDRGKKEVDQFVRIQKINGQISELELNIGNCRGQIQQAKLKIGDMAIELLRAGSLVSAPMSAVLDEIDGIDRQIGSLENEIVLKRAEIERIRMEDKTPKAAGAEGAAPPPPPAPEAARACSQCGAPAGAGLFCAQCGAKLPE